MDDEERYEESGESKEGGGSNGLAIGMCIGVAIGAALGAAMGNLGLWLPLGLCFGALLGFVLNRAKSGGSGSETAGVDEAYTEVEEASSAG